MIIIKDGFMTENTSNSLCGCDNEWTSCGCDNNDWTSCGCDDRCGCDD